MVEQVRNIEEAHRKDDGTAAAEFLDLMDATDDALIEAS